MSESPIMSASSTPTSQTQSPTPSTPNIARRLFVDELPETNTIWREGNLVVIAMVLPDEKEAEEEERKYVDRGYLKRPGVPLSNGKQKKRRGSQGTQGTQGTQAIKPSGASLGGFKILLETATKIKFQHMIEMQAPVLNVLGGSISSTLKEFTTVLKNFEETTNLQKKLRQVQYALMYMQFRTVGPQYLKDMTDSIPSEENLTTFIKIVKPTNKDVNDRLIRAGQVTLILNCILRPLETELESKYGLRDQ